MDIFPFFPVNLEGGPDFLVLYAVVVVVSLALLMKYRAVTLAAIDRRAPSDAVPNPLAKGRLPTGEEVYAVAWLRGGRSAVRDTLVAAAVADGWFRKHDEGVEVLRPRSHGDAACLDAFAEMCRTLPTSSQSSSTLPNVTTAPAVRDLATTAARNAEPRLQELLLAAGFWREPHIAESVQQKFH
jgi:hypothetical protein